ncbi:Fructose-bisphosphate aldolase 1 [Nowakowskiella sp. JEL0407]|nr:Fructose-bisphosphate aldolase 1 [Nowakowskiella sp. JEL0407]
MIVHSFKYIWYNIYTKYFMKYSIPSTSIKLTSTTSIDAKFPFFSESSYFTTYFNDLDLYFHMNNGRYASRADLAQFNFGGKFFDVQGQGDYFRDTYVATAGTYYFFKKELKYLQKFEIRTRLLTYNEKWFFFEHRYLIKTNPKKKSVKFHSNLSGFDSAISVSGDDDLLAHYDKSIPEGYTLACVSISKLVMKRTSGQTVPTSEFLRKIGYIVDVPNRKDIKVTNAEFKRIKKEIQAHNDQIELVRRSGWEIGRRIMEIGDIAIASVSLFLPNQSFIGRNGLERTDPITANLSITNHYAIMGNIVNKGKKQPISPTVVPVIVAPVDSSQPANSTATKQPVISAQIKPASTLSKEQLKKMSLKDLVPAGVITGDNVRKVFKFAHEHGFAIPAFNCTSTSTVNAALESARDSGSPIIIQFSQGGSAYFAGKGLSNAHQEASVLGAVAGAHYVRSVAKAYGIPVIVHSDHCAKKLLEWFDGMLLADEEYFKAHGEPLFSSHMLDLSEEPKAENIEICMKYLERMAPINCLLEMEIGVTGGEEDGVNNEGVDNAALYTQPEDIWEIYENFSKITDLFTIAAAFGNVHGVYAAGNVKLHPELLEKHQAFVKEKLGTDDTKPVWFVFHGGSGSTDEEIQVAVKAGVVKMNIDTDTQWAYWNGLRTFYENKKGYLQSQIGNPDGETKPNKKFYDPRVWVREAEKGMITRVKEALAQLGTAGKW